MGANKDEIDRLLQMISDDPRILSMRSRTGGTYADEPIIRRASQMESYRPQMIQRMREIQQAPEARMMSQTRLFVEQARLMEEYEDNCPYHGAYHHYCPSYSTMDDRQLRGYFTWRAHVRAGQFEPATSSFAFVYLYELLNGVGTEPGEKGFLDIRGFWQGMRPYLPDLDRYVKVWLVDYAAWHGLDPALVADLAGAAHDSAILCLENAEKRLVAAADAGVAGAGSGGSRRKAPFPFGQDMAFEQGIFDAVAELIRHPVKQSAGYIACPEDYVHVTAAVFYRLVNRGRGGKSGQGYVEGLFGLRYPMVHHMFAGSMFCFPKEQPDREYQICDATRYTCKNGRWSKNSYHDGGGASDKLEHVVLAIDQRLCEVLGQAGPAGQTGAAKYVVSIIDAEVKAYLAWKEARAPVRVEIDLSKLAGIRVAAAATREALLVDEERENIEIAEATPEEREAPAPEEPAAEEPAAASPFGLAPEERSLLNDLLGGKAPDDAANVDLLVDSINEKLFDLLGDTALEFDETGAPALVDDYAEDVRAALND